MSSLATIAREAALKCEAKKHAYRQTQDGVVVSFVLHPQEVPDGLATAALGTRYVLALVELGDDEFPVQRKEAPASDPQSVPSRSADAPSGSGGTGKRSWNELSYTAQAAIRCDDVAFRRFLQERYGADAGDADAAAESVRTMCGVRTRKELIPGSQEAGRWLRLDAEYRLWQRALEHGA